jgi:LysR family carnitine catabolism transcriptional activator
MTQLPISLRQLRAFATVARLGSFRRAAEQIHVAQPTLSQTISALEAELGTQLFRRHARGVELTEAGRQMLSTSESVLHSLEFTIASLRQRGVRDSLRIAALPSLARQVVVPAYREFRARRGETALFIRDAIGEEVLRMVRAREVDFGLTVMPGGAADLRTHRLLRSELRLVVAPDHLLARRRDGVAWRELAEEHFIFVSRRSATYKAVADAFREAGIFPRHFLETQSAETAACLAAEGLGITVLHAHNLAEMAHYGFVELPVREPDCGLDIALIALDQPLPEASRIFWDFLQQRAGSAGAELSQ